MGCFSFFISHFGGVEVPFPARVNVSVKNHGDAGDSPIFLSLDDFSGKI